MMPYRVEFDDVATEHVLLILPTSRDLHADSRALEAIKSALADDLHSGVDEWEGLKRVTMHGLTAL